METIPALIPAYQEGPRIATVVEGATACMPVAVVDDDSTDETSAQAEAAGAVVLRQIPRAGKRAALRTGFRYALEQGAAAVAVEPFRASGAPVTTRPGRRAVDGFDGSGSYPQEFRFG